jgi:hypothetical protein
MNIKMLKIAIASLVLCVSSLANAGVINFEGSIDDGTEVDFWSVYVTTSGTFTFDVLAYEVANDFFDNGLGNDRLDSYIYLFANDADGALIGSDDDGGLGSDGSVSGLDSLMTLNLSVGSYLFAIGDYFLSEVEARNQLNSTNTGDTLNGRYSVSISSEDGVALVSSIPEPSTLAIFALAIMGIASRRTKKQ